MVDAIGSVTSQQVRTAKKDPAVNWKNCTSDEILEYEKQGQEVPDYILQWAVEFNKQQNAPEDVTYEMAMGATTMAGVNGNNPQNPNGETTDVEADALREKMTQEGVSIRDQAKIFRDYSKEYTNEIQNLMDSMEQYMAQSEAAAANAEDAKNDVMSRIQALMSSKKENKTGDVSGAIEAARIDREIRNVGQAGLSTIESAAMPIDNALNQVSSAEFTSLTGRGYGNQAISIGNMPELNRSFFDFAGRITKKAGEKEVKQSDAGDQQFGENRGTANGFRDSVNANEDEVRRASGAVLPKQSDDIKSEDAKDKAEGDNTVNDADNDQIAKESNNKKEEVAQEDTATIDDKVLTDPNEILKRKERRGLV